MLMSTLVITSCKKNDITDEPTETQPGTNEQAHGTLDLGSNVNADFFGQINDENGNAIEGADVTVGNKTTTTDADGIFHISDATVKEDLAFIKAEKSGYFLGSRSLIPNTTSMNNVKIQMLTLEIVGTVSSGEEATLTTDGASVTFKGHYVDANGTPYSGSVDVAMKYMSPTAPETQSQMPGMLYAQNEAGESGALETYGMIAVELISSTGEPLQIAQGSNASIRMPIDPEQIANAPATIPLWYFDEVAGYWVEEGAAALIDGAYIGSVDHFSFWNCDAFGDDCQFFGVVQDAQGNPVPNAVVNIETNSGSTSGVTNADGTFFTYLPAGDVVTLEIYDQCGTLIYYGDFSPCTNGQVNQEVLTIQNTSESIHITGTAQDCSFNLIESGQAEITVNGSTFYYPIEDGIIDFTFYGCVAPSTIDITVTDFGSLQQDTQTGVTVTSGVANVGTMTTCTGLDEWIYLDVDGNSETWIAPLDFTQVDSNGTSQIAIIGTVPNFFAIQFSDITPGTYDLVENIELQTGFYYIGGSSPIVDFTIAPAMTATFNSYPAVGGYIEITMSGTFYDDQSVLHTVTGNMKVQRDL